MLYMHHHLKLKVHIKMEVSGDKFLWGDTWYGTLTQIRHQKNNVAMSIRFLVKVN
jgi:hypothetical protein